MQKGDTRYATHKVNTYVKVAIAIESIAMYVHGFSYIATIAS